VYDRFFYVLKVVHVSAPQDLETPHHCSLVLTKDWNVVCTCVCVCVCAWLQLCTHAKLCPCMQFDRLRKTTARMSHRLVAAGLFVSAAGKATRERVFSKGEEDLRGECKVSFQGNWKPRKHVLQSE